MGHTGSPKETRWAQHIDGTTKSAMAHRMFSPIRQKPPSFLLELTDVTLVDRSSPDFTPYRGVRFLQWLSI